MEIHDGDEVLCFDQQQRSLVATTALGLMGLQLPQLCDVMKEHWMDTIHVLLRHDSLTLPMLRSVLEKVDIVFREMREPRLLELIEAVLKAAVNVKSMTSKSSSDCWIFTRKTCSEGSDAAWAVEKVLEYVMKEKHIFSQLSPIARLHVWRLRPCRLKTDLSDLAEDFMRISLGESSLKVECRGFSSMVAGLALAPDMLNEVQRLLLMWSSSVAITGASRTSHRCSPRHFTTLGWTHQVNVLN